MDSLCFAGTRVKLRLLIFLGLMRSDALPVWAHTAVALESNTLAADEHELMAFESRGFDARVASGGVELAVGHERKNLGVTKNRNNDSFGTCMNCSSFSVET